MDMGFSCGQGAEQTKGDKGLPPLGQMFDKPLHGSGQKTPSPPEARQQQQRQGQGEQRNHNRPNIQGCAQNAGPYGIENPGDQKGQVGRQFQQSVQGHRSNGLGRCHTAPPHQQPDLGRFAAELGAGGEQADGGPDHPVDSNPAKGEVDAHPPQEQPPAVGKKEGDGAVNRYINQKRRWADLREQIELFAPVHLAGKKPKQEQAEEECCPIQPAAVKANLHAETSAPGLR
jgi:hypothetical protein